MTSVVLSDVTSDLKKSVRTCTVLNYFTVFMHTITYRATLESYAKLVRGQGRSQYAPVYPVLTQLLKIGFGQL